MTLYIPSQLFKTDGTKNAGKNDNDDDDEKKDEEQRKVEHFK